MNRPLRILLVAAEMEPIVSTGGLGRAVGGLAGALKMLGIDVRVVLPKYRNNRVCNVFGLTRLVQETRIRIVDRFGSFGIYRDELPGDVPVYLIEKDKYFDREYIYGPPEHGFEDNAERFSFFNLAILEIFTQIGFYPDVIHCHDWHTGLIPVYLETLFRDDPLYSHVRTLFTLHDLRHRGIFPRDTLNMTGLPKLVYDIEGLEFYGGISFLKAAISYADVLSTESKRYKQEIQTKEFGNGFDGLFQTRSKDIYGVINGVDYKHFDPRVDPYIAINYTKDEIQKKRYCKEDLLQTCELKQKLDLPLVSMIAPLESEKGVDLLVQALEDMLSLNLQFIFLNDGNVPHDEYTGFLNWFGSQHASHVRCYIEYDEQLKHKILAGSDILLMPSRSEPCGVTQMYGLKYGTIPVVRATGGLDDTIIEVTPESGKGNGFKFIEYTPEALLATLREALMVYRNEARWNLLQANAMRVNYSWVYTAKKYQNLYKLAMNRGK